MRCEEEYQNAVQLIEIGINDCEISRRLGISRNTIRDWRVCVASGSGGRIEFWSGRRQATCFRCIGGWVDEEAYAYLLGVYLGDGFSPSSSERISLADV
jgi:Homeodomain-like domain